jgi:hypothetical protein
MELRVNRSRRAPSVTSFPGFAGSSLLRVSAMCVLAASGLLHAQTAASLTVMALDPESAIVPGAQVVVTDLEHGSTWNGQTEGGGTVSFDQLPAGDFQVEVSKPGFDKARVEHIGLTIRDRRTVRVALKIAAAQSSVTVTDVAQGVTTDASRAVALEHSYIENLPVNGRNAESLVLMAPGVTSAGDGPEGSIHANGLRANTNYYTIDGLSVNTPMGGGGGFPGAGGMGGGPESFGSGGPTSLVTIDGMQEMKVQTSPFAPEFGRSAGAQISITSRGGTNNWHGSLFYYYRHDRFNANDWFSNSRAVGRGVMRQNRPGGTLGGPVRKNRTFVFATFEETRLQSPQNILASVPSLTARTTAPAALRKLLNVFPVPNGASLDDMAAEYRAQTSNPSSGYSPSVRLDQAIGTGSTIFFRYSQGPMHGVSRASDMESPNLLSRRDSRSQSASLGWAKTTGVILHDLRVNYSTSRSWGQSVMDNFGGATALTDAQVFPTGVTSATGQFSFNIMGASGYTLGSRSGNDQTQVNAVYGVTKSVARHSFKVGFDARRTLSTMRRQTYSQNLMFSGIEGANIEGTVMSGIATNVRVTSSLPTVYPVFTNFSAYLQDTWRATSRTTITAGFRWDVNPAPGTRRGPKPFSLLTAFSGSSVTQNEPIYATRWYDIAPRIGLAYQMDDRPGHEMMLRLGFGEFYDMGYGLSTAAFNGAPYAEVSTISSADYPLAAADAAPPAMPPVEPYGQVVGASASLQTPKIYQVSVAWERAYTNGGMLSVGYVNTRGRNLMKMEMQAPYTDAYDTLVLVSNGSQSDYHALQTQYRKSIGRNLQTQLSYTWGHSIDTASNDMGVLGGFATISGGERGSSDYDIKHNINWSGSYTLPAPGSRLAKAVLGGWSADWVVTMRSGMPFDVQGVTYKTSDSSSTTEDTGIVNNRGGLYARVRPNYNGQPLWVSNSKVAAGKRLNPAAFWIKTNTYAQGNMSRNAIRGFGAFQADVSLRRQFVLTEGVRLSVSAQANNVLNHPSFANPISPQGSTSLTSPTFGIATRMLGASGPGGGINSAYRTGGPRSMEFSARLQF